MIHPNRAQTMDAVAAHYDELDVFYPKSGASTSITVSGRRAVRAGWRAVEALVDLMATRLDLAPGQALCDIGCGYGATAVRLAELHGVHVTGVTVSGVQATIAAAKSPSHGSIAVLHRDWLSNGLPDRHFDRAYAIESSEARCPLLPEEPCRPSLSTIVGGPALILPQNRACSLTPLLIGVQC
jgi:tocopherol O-methyltransferase